MRKIAKVFTLMMMCSTCMLSQDLIERVSMGITKNNADVKPNKIAQEVMLKNNFRSIKPLSPIKNNNSKVFREIKFKLNKSALSNFENENIQLTIPFKKDAALILKLIPSSPLSPTYESHDEKGNMLKSRNYKFYKGIVEDDQNSIVSLTVTDDDMQILISDDFGNYNLGKVNESENYVLYNDRNIPELDFECAYIDNAVHDMPIEEQQMIDVDKKDKTNGNCVKVHIIADFRTYQNFSNNSANVEAHIMGFWGAVETIYDNESINVELSGTTIYTADDLFNADVSVLTALNNMSANVGSVDALITGGANLVHLISAKCAPNVSCSYSGIANLYCSNGVCNRSALCFPDPWAVSEISTGYENYPAYSWTVNVFAHEMGHNMGSPHTHDCSWPGGAIDNCYAVESGSCSMGSDPGLTQGTIMSYCHRCIIPSSWNGSDASYCSQSNCNNIIPNCPNPGINLNNGFGTIPGNHIRAQYTAATCLTGCSSTCTDGQMNGNETGIDCGGPDCAACPTCSDGIQNQGETNVDCGGPNCSTCIPGCSTDPNAYNYAMNANINQPCQTCSDGIQNGDETGVDCGGTSYPNCQGCPCLEVFASNYNLPGPCEYDCTASFSSIASNSTAMDTIITSAAILSTSGTINVNHANPLLWRATNSVEINANTTIDSELTIDLGPCND